MFCALFYSRFYFANNSRTSDTTHDQKLGVVVLTRLGRIYIYIGNNLFLRLDVN